jgi:phosphopantothenoylcysteine decarboxylase/phosphopantothenate--cysteine ligase
VVVTAGGTREPIDPVRYIGNRSSGKQGHALARAAADQGAKVTLITAADQPIPSGVTSVEVETAEQMRDAVLAASAGADVVVMAAAVADFRPIAAAGRKLKKHDGLPEIVLAANTDILGELGANRSEGLMLVGFAAETNDVVANAVEKLERKNIDMIIANDVHEVGAGFSTDTNHVTIITHDHQVEVELGSKYEIAQAVISSICDHLELD